MDTFKSNLQRKLLVEDNFTEQSKENWVLETDGIGDVVTYENGYVDINAEQSATLWYKHKLNGNIRIEYDATFIVEGKPHERLSDLNCFWNATNPANMDNFFSDSPKRGAFCDYNPLNLYYVGYGANYNTTTRFRKYQNNTKPIITEYTDSQYLLEKNKSYHIMIELEDGYVRFYRNNDLLVNYFDRNAYSEGYFGFRTTISHLRISNFRCYKLL